MPWAAKVSAATDGVLEFSTAGRSVLAKQTPIALSETTDPEENCSCRYQFRQCFLQEMSLLGINHVDVANLALQPG